jgi:ElaB/YqjD/DUF883 family membrane-anchored ribosome-binding protein
MGLGHETGSRVRRNGHVHGAMKSRANDVVTDISELKKDVTKLAEAIAKVAKVEAATYTDQLSHIRDDVRSRAEVGVAYVGDHVRARPAAAVGISVGVGMLLGLVLAAKR